jgi:LCP family protein required for cell wall assembly
MIRKLARFALVVLIITVACNIPNQVVEVSLAPTPLVVSQLVVDAVPGSTATATPFMPIGPTPTSIATNTPAPTDTPEAAPTDPAMPPTEVPVYQPQSEGTVNLMVIGSDLRPGGGYRTDVMMLVSIHADSGTVSLVSFPRDLYVSIPGWMEQRINTAFQHGGFSLLANTLETNFGVRPQYYVMTNFDGFIDIIDSLGGVTINIGKTLQDKCDLPQAVNTYCTVNPGPMNMNGKMALWYVRSRHSTSDFDRLRRAQEVLYGVFDRLMSVDAVSHLPDLYNSYRDSVETNMGLDDMLPLVPVASAVYNDSSRLHRYTIGPGQVYPYVTAEGAQVLLPNYAAIRQIVQEAVAGP